MMTTRVVTRKMMMRCVAIGLGMMSVSALADVVAWMARTTRMIDRSSMGNTGVVTIAGVLATPTGEGNGAAWIPKGVSPRGLR